MLWTPLFFLQKKEGHRFLADTRGPIVVHRAPRSVYYLSRTLLRYPSPDVVS